MVWTESGAWGQEWLSSIGIKYYEGKMNLNWKPILKSIMEVRPSHLRVAQLPGCMCHPFMDCPVCSCRTMVINVSSAGTVSGLLCNAAWQCNRSRFRKGH